MANKQTAGRRTVEAAVIVESHTFGKNAEADSDNDSQKKESNKKENEENAKLEMLKPTG